MDNKVDMATLLRNELRRRFPTDTITIGYGEAWWAIYVNSICYMGGYKNAQHFIITRPGVSVSLSLSYSNQQEVVSFHDPELFEKAKAGTLRNLIYYEREAAKITGSRNR